MKTSREIIEFGEAYVTLLLSGPTEQLIDIANKVAKMEDAVEQAFGILNNIPEVLDSWEKANASIQEAHDILETAKLEKQL